jgi:spoIIIJ-associated protein
MEWVETTAKSVDEAKELALDQLGVMADEAEFEVMEEPRPGLFGRLRGEARVRARVRPASVRPKQQRRGRGEAAARGDGTKRNDAAGRSGTRAGGGAGSDDQATPATTGTADPAVATATPGSADGAAVDVAEGPAPSVEDVTKAAEEFMAGLAGAFGFDVTTRTQVEGSEIDVALDGQSLGLLVGPGGRTLLAVQDLARVAAQRRLGDHETRLRIDVAGYRERRRVALERFAQSVAAQVKESGSARSLDPMPSADRKIVHDVLTSIDGVASRSEGEEPYRRIVVSPA